MEKSGRDSDIASVGQRFAHTLNMTRKTECFLDNNNAATNTINGSRYEDIHRPVGSVELLLLGSMTSHSFPLRNDATQRRSDGDGR
jgi:hypothetical protein